MPQNERVIVSHNLQKLLSLKASVWICYLLQCCMLLIGQQKGVRPVEFLLQHLSSPQMFSLAPQSGVTSEV